jgi:hypothetical protein
VSQDVNPEELCAQRFARSPRMVGRRIAGEYLLVPIVGRGADLDAIYTLNPLGAFIWERLDGQTPGAAIIQAIVEGFEVESDRAADDYRSFLSQLVSIRAVVLSPPSSQAGTGGGTSPEGV